MARHGPTIQREGEAVRHCIRSQKELMVLNEDARDGKKPVEVY